MLLCTALTVELKGSMSRIRSVVFCSIKQYKLSQVPLKKITRFYRLMMTHSEHGEWFMCLLNKNQSSYLCVLHHNQKNVNFSKQSDISNVSKFQCILCLVAKSCPTLCDPMDCSLLGSSVLGFSRQEYWRGLPFSLLFDFIFRYRQFVVLLKTPLILF